MLDVAIGLILVFLLVSLICTALTELIEGFLRQRSSNLQQGIREILQDSEGTGLSKKFYEHPLIAGLYKGKYDMGRTKNLPSYIPSRLFALVMIDLVQPLSSNAEDKTDTTQNPELQAQKNTIESVIKKMVKLTGADLNLTIAEIENWFNGSMDRIAGWYKRKVQKILIGLGLVIAVSMNVDTIAVFKSLINDTDVRNSLVAAAQEIAKPKANDEDSSNKSARARLEENTKKLRELRLPIGWDWVKPDELSKDPKYVTNYHLAIPEGKTWFFKIMGWLMTALAVSLGSSFWFDALNKFMVIRSTVKPHEKSVEEDSEDRQNKK
jgi:hypothetical protein